MEWIKRSSLTNPVAQFEIVSNDGVPLHPDLAYPDAKVAIELQGYRAHGSRRSFDADNKRFTDLAALGWIVFPFTSKTTEEELIDKLRSALRHRR